MVGCPMEAFSNCETQVTDFKPIRVNKSSSLIQEKRNSIIIFVCVHTQLAPFLNHSTQGCYLLGLTPGGMMKKRYLILCLSVALST